MKRAEARSRLAQQQDHGDQKPGEHPGVAIQKGGERYELTAEIRVTPMPRLCTLAGTTMRCLSTVRSESVLTEVDSASACILRRTAGLPLIHRLWSNSAGYSLTAALGGHTEQCDGCGQTRVCYNSCRDRH